VSEFLDTSLAKRGRVKRAAAMVAMIYFFIYQWISVFRDVDLEVFILSEVGAKTITVIDVLTIFVLAKVDYLIDRLAHNN
jgi:hypothetical protein